MKTLEIKGTLRPEVGSKQAVLSRREGKVPCVLYGGAEQVHFLIEEPLFKDLIYTPSVYIVVLDIDGKKHKSILQEAQFHKVSDKIIHADFLQVFDDKDIIMSIPVKIEGVAKGVRAGGKQVIKKRKLRIKALPVDMPDTINVNIEELDILQSIKISDIANPKLKFLEPLTSDIIVITTTRAVAKDATTPTTPAK